MSKVELVSLWAILVWSSCFYSQFGRAQIDEITDQSEVKALKVIKSNLIDPMGKLNSWNNDDDPCTSNWTGVICYNSSVNDGYLHVLELQLLKMNLSGTLAPEFGLLPYMKILDVMWNQINGTIPKEIGNIKSLELLLLNGNQLTGPLPEELGYLPNLDRIQIDQNQISGTLPKSFANLNKTKHFHMNNNSISGEIPSELSRLPSLVHFLLDNNNLSGSLPQDFSKLPKLLILQLDNNKLNGTIPASYGNMTKLLKLSLRNCNLQGPVPDFSGLPKLGYLDLSGNQLTGPIPTNKLSNNITTIDLSDNNLTGPIPSNFSGLPNLQRLSLDNNNLSGSVPSSIWKNMSFTGNKSLILDFQNNSLTSISAALQPPQNVTILLYGNPVCAKANQLNIAQFCQQNISEVPGAAKISKVSCGSCPTDLDYEYNPLSPLSCFCSVPLKVQYRLKSPGFSNFLPYEDDFQGYLTSGLKIAFDQLDIDSFIWEEGPRLKMNLKLFPDRTNLFNQSEVQRIKSDFTGWLIPDSDLFGPYELLNFVLGSYASAPSRSSSGLSKGALIGIIFGVIAGAATVTAVITILFMRRHSRYSAVSRKRSSSKFPIKIDGTRDFTFEEMSLATNDFNSSALVGQGGYGNVYKGILADGTVVAIKRATEGSLQGSKEFCTEIELLSRLHHRNLVSLVGYCDEEDEQMLVYEFMPNGTLRDHLSPISKEPLTFSMRLSIALGSSRGILYLHTEADPPIFHRDIKASNILLDSKLSAKVADFGLSRLAPVPDIEGTVPGHVSTVVKGTPGYLDPEYFLTHKLTDKSDVYSLGVVFLELLTGMKPIWHGKNIVREVSAAYQSGLMFSVIDNRMGSYPSECIERFVSLALRCCQDETDARPPMSEIVRELENIWRMTPELADMATPSDSSIVITNNDKGGTGEHYVSQDISGSNLLSGVIPTIAPR